MIQRWAAAAFLATEVRKIAKLERSLATESDFGETNTRDEAGGRVR